MAFRSFDQIQKAKRPARMFLEALADATVHAADMPHANVVTMKNGTWSLDIPIFKLEPTKHLVYGWASVITEKGRIITDSQDDQITEEDLVKAAHGFMTEHRNTGDLHADYGKGYGSVVESMVFTSDVQKALGIDLGKVGWFICHKIADQRLWQGIVSGQYKAMSIGGSGRRVAVK